MLLTADLSSFSGECSLQCGEIKKHLQKMIYKCHTKTAVGYKNGYKGYKNGYKNVTYMNM